MDIVTICVKVPEHRTAALAALRAGKHVYCEWPLGRPVAEAEELAAAAARAGVYHAIGLQGRAAPAARRARELITAGAIGRPLSAHILSTTAGYAPALPSAYAYLNDPANGANLSTILGGHTLDLAEHLLGAAVEIEAMSAIQFPSVRLLDTGGTTARTTPDQLFTLTRHESGCLPSTEIDGNRPADTPSAFEVIGTDGRLRLLGGHPHGFQAGTLSLEADVAFPPPDPPHAGGGLLGAAANVAEVYAALAHDIGGNAWTVPGFGHAAHLTRLIAAVTCAAQDSQRRHVRTMQGA